MLKDRKMHYTIMIMLVVLLPTILGLLGRIKAQGDVVNFLTHHLNNARTGWNSRETQLTPANVGPNLHKLWENGRINGQIYAAPLYYNLDGEERLFIVTENNWIYVLDAATGEEIIGKFLGEPSLTQFEFERKLYGGCGDINPLHGITSTPVIDPETNTLYLVDLTMERNRQVYKAHAIDIFTGEEASDQWPVTIRGSFEGVEFEAWQQTQRGALTLIKENNRLYIPFSSRCDAYNWHGWIFGLDIDNPTESPLIFNTSPDGNGAGMWGPGGMSIDENGAGYFVTGNGTVNFPPVGRGKSFGMSVLRIDPLNLTRPFSYDPQDYFTAGDFGPTNARDTDLGGSSALVIPDQSATGTETPHLLFTAGKDGRVYLINRDNLGGLGGELQRMRVSQGMRVAPTYYEDEAGRRFIYVTGTGQGRLMDWEDGPINIAPASPPARQRAALGTGPAMVEFQDKLFVAWISNTDDREVLIKSSQDGSNWSSSPVEVGGNAAMRTSPALAAFNDRLYVSWVDNGTQRIMVKSSENGQTWSDAQELEEVAERDDGFVTYTSMTVFRDNLYLAFISSGPPYNILLKSTRDGDFSRSKNISVRSSQTIPVSAPFIIPFGKDLYSFWLRNKDDRSLLYKVSSTGRDWPTDEISFNESANQNSGISGLVLNSIVEGPNPGPPRLHILFVANDNGRGVLGKSIGISDVEPGNQFTYERAAAASIVGAAVFRGKPRFAFVSNSPDRRLLLKTGGAGYPGRGLIAFRLVVDRNTGKSRFYPAWTSADNYDYLPGSVFITSNGRRNGIAWVTEGLGFNPRLRAYNAVTGVDLFNSNTRAPSDRINDSGRKFVETIVANGRVYVATNSVTAYSLQP